MTEPDPEPSSTQAATDQILIEICAMIEQDVIPILERAGDHNTARRYRQNMELLRLVALAETPEQLDTLKRLDTLIWAGHGG